MRREQAVGESAPGEPGGVRDPQRDPRGAARRAVRAPHAHASRASRSRRSRTACLPISQQATVALASLGYHDYEGIAVRDDEKPRSQRDLGNNTCLILRNHGLLTVGSTVADAFLRCTSCSAPARCSCWRRRAGRRSSRSIRASARGEGERRRGDARPGRVAGVAGTLAQARPAQSGLCGLEQF